MIILLFYVCFVCVLCFLSVVMQNKHWAPIHFISIFGGIHLRLDGKSIVDQCKDQKFVSEK